MKFTIVATDYDGSVSPDILRRFLTSLKNQTFKDFEVIIMHDGVRSNPVPEEFTVIENFHFVESMFRANAWGHNLRSLGMKMAKGDWIINTNTDNVYYKDALQNLADSIENNIPIMIAKVKMMGMNEKGLFRWYDKPRDYTKSVILTGKPPVFGNIDMMSLIANRYVWEQVHYWYDITETSDGSIYELITHMFPYKNLDFIIGEHY